MSRNPSSMERSPVKTEGKQIVSSNRDERDDSRQGALRIDVHRGEGDGCKQKA